MTLPPNNNHSSAPSNNEQKKQRITIPFSAAAVNEARLQQEDIDFIKDSKAAMLATTSPYTKWTLYIIVTFFIIIFTWSNCTNIDEVSRGIGKIVPYSQVQIMQNLEGGILEKIFVREGETVKKQQVVAKLDDTLFASQYKQGYNKYLSLLATIARLEAETNHQSTIKFPPEIANNDKLTQQQNILFKSKIALLQNTVQNLQKNHALVQKEINITEPMVKQGVLSQIELLRLQRQLSEIKSKIDSVQDNFYENELSELNKSRDDATILSASLAALKDRMERTLIRSQIDGIVKQIHINTVGGVIKPGEPIMEIVPIHDKLVVEAMLRPSDIAFVHPGQRALVKVTAYDYSIYGGLKATVTNVSADTNIDQRGNSFYEVTLETDKNYLDSKKGTLPIMPGMTTVVDIVTGKRSVMHYILKPILRAKEKALRER